MNPKNSEFQINFYSKLVEDYGLDYLSEQKKVLCPDCTHEEWVEYCFSLESPF